MSVWQNFRASLFGYIVPQEEKGAALIITAQVEKIEKHPNADRLRLVSVRTQGVVIEPIVCGATNFQEGDIVALALPGALIPRNIHSEEHESFVLEKAVIRGIESQGMLCSGFELGFRDTPETREEGILIFREGTPLGEDVNNIADR